MNEAQKKAILDVSSFAYHLGIVRGLISKMTKDNEHLEYFMDRGVGVPELEALKEASDAIAVCFWEEKKLPLIKKEE